MLEHIMESQEKDELEHIMESQENDELEHIMESQENDELEDIMESQENDELERLLDKYDFLINCIDYKNNLYYGALFQQLFSDITYDDQQGKIDRSIDDLSKIITKACEKLKFDIHNASIKQLIKFYSILIEKLGGTKKMRGLDTELLEELMCRMYSDLEILDILELLEEKQVNPENIIGISPDNEILFSDDSLFKIEPSSKFDELIDFYGEIANLKKKKE